MAFAKEAMKKCNEKLRNASISRPEAIFVKAYAILSSGVSYILYNSRIPTNAKKKANGTATQGVKTAATIKAI